MKPKDHRIRSLVQCGLFAALLVLSAWIQIPGAVPFTLQTMVVCILAGVMGFRQSLLTVAVYIGLGVIGLPVFSGFTGGIGALFGVTGGYIMGFLPMAAVIGISIRLVPDSRIAQILSMAVGTLLCYLVGAIWFAAVYAARGDVLSVSAVLSACVLPFLLPECAKITAAVLVTRRLRKIVEQ